MFQLILVLYQQLLTLSFSVARDEEESDDSAIIRGVGRGKKKNLWPLERDQNANPRLSVFKENEERPSAGEMKRILRAFFIYSYHMF